MASRDISSTLKDVFANNGEQTLSYLKRAIAPVWKKKLFIKTSLEFSFGMDAHKDGVAACIHDVPASGRLLMI